MISLTIDELVEGARLFQSKPKRKATGQTGPRLNQAIADQIRKECTGYGMGLLLAKRYGISQTSVYHITSGRTYRKGGTR